MQNSTLSRLPPGYRFLPTDQELMGYYLAKKVVGSLSCEEATIIQEYNLFGEEEPWEIFNKLGGNKLDDNGLYFFTTLCKKTVNGTKNMNRIVGTNGGKWHGSDKGFEVKSYDGNTVIGLRKRFIYQNPISEHDGCWMLLQYGSECLSKDTVICQLKKSRHGISKMESRKRKSADLEAVEDAYDDDDDRNQIVQSMTNDSTFNLEPIGSQAREPQQVIENQEMGFEVENIVGYDGIFFTKDSFDNETMFMDIENLLQAEPDQANFIQEPVNTENQEVQLEESIVRVKDNAIPSTEYFSVVNDERMESEVFLDGADIRQILQSLDEDPVVNLESTVSLAQEPHITENQETGLGVFSTENTSENDLAIVNDGNVIEVIIIEDDDGLCGAEDECNNVAVVNDLADLDANTWPIASVGDDKAGDVEDSNSKTPPAANAVPVMDAGLIKFASRFLNFQSFQQEDCYEDGHIDLGSLWS